MPEVIRIEDQNDLVDTKVYPHAQWPFEKFNPIQSRLNDLYTEDANVAVAASTSAGKTICSEIFAAYTIRVLKKKVAYIGPLKALAKEKEIDWTKTNHHFADLKISICTGDYRVTPSRIKELDQADVILMTPEMLASRVRNQKSEKSHFLKDIGLLICDEFHLITVPSRGDHLEVALMKLTEMNPDMRMVLLSATMPNVDEICRWISQVTNKNTYFLESKYRPCPLGVHYETYWDGDRKYEDKEREKVSTALGIVEHYKDDKFLIFVHTKRTGQMMLEYLTKVGVDTEFHNADLSLEKRISVEERFKNDPKFRVLVATSTLAWGINCPARRVIIVGVDRGLQRVEVYDINQMCGRSGRPAFDKRGDAYVLVPESSKEEVVKYLKHQPPIRSTLLNDVGGHYKILAFHLVSEIHHGNVSTKEGFHNWFRRSLAYFQSLSFGDVVIDKVIDLLTKCKAVTVEGEVYKVTPVGTVASMFYFSPFDCADLRNNFSQFFKRADKDDYALAYALANVDSQRFGIVNRTEKDELGRFAKEIEARFGKECCTESVIKATAGYYNLLNGFDNGVFAALQAGLRHDADRTVEVLGALDSMSGRWGQHDFFKTLRLRLAYGVREELTELCQIPNIGKARAEKLYKANIRDVHDFLGRDEFALSKIINLSVDKTRESLKGAVVLKNKAMM